MTPERMTAVALVLIVAAFAHLRTSDRAMRATTGRDPMTLSTQARRALLLVIITGVLLAFVLPESLPWSGVRL